MPDEKDPLLEFAAVEDEDLKAGKPPEPDLNVDPPQDAPERERNEDGTFKGKEGEEKPKPKEEPKAKDEPKKEDPPPKKEEFVPLAKFLDDRAKYKAELEQRDLTIKQINERLAKFEKDNAPKEEPAPDFVEDPQGYVDHRLNRALSTLEQANKKAEEQGKQATETAARAREIAETQAFMQRLGAHEQQYAAQNPDYFDAIAHVRGIRDFQLQQFAPQLTAEQRMEVIANEEQQLAVTLARAGRDPCATAHELAKRYGFAPKKPDPTPKPTPPAGALPPDQSLGGGHGAPDLSREEDAPTDPVALALASLNRKRA